VVWYSHHRSQIGEEVLLGQERSELRNARRTVRKKQRETTHREDLKIVEKTASLDLNGARGRNQGSGKAGKKKIVRMDAELKTD